MKMPSLLAVLALAAVPMLATNAAAQWNPERFSQEDTLELLTVNADGEEHWSPVWLAVIDGQVYVRLGTRAAGRVTSSARTPLVDVRIAGETFHNVRVDPAPDMAERVATVMADKYWFDVVARQFSHPLTARLVPQDSGRI